MRFRQSLRTLALPLSILCGLAFGPALRVAGAQDNPPSSPAQASPTGPSSAKASQSSSSASQTPDAPQPQAARTRLAPPELSPPDAAEALRIRKLPLVNGAPYDQPSRHDLVVAYAHETYLLPGAWRSTVSAVYSQIRERPAAWGDGFGGFSQRLGSAEGITIINGNVRLGMELTFREDLRYLPCRGCSIRRKIANSLLAEVTARHGEDGRRFFTLTPAISDFSGPIIAHSLWYPNGFDPFAGVVATRVVAVTRVGVHLAEEAWVDRHRLHRRREREPERP